MKVLLAHPGTQYSYQLAKQLYNRNLLFEFHTGIAYGKDHWVYKICSRLPSSLYRKISNRFINDVPDKYIRRHFFNELKGLIRLKLGVEEEKTLFARNKQFQEIIPSKSLSTCDVVIGFDTSSLLLIQRCKGLSKTFFMDVSIGHPVSKDSVYKKLQEMYADWVFTIKHKDSMKIKLEEEEMKLADHIVVASTFTLKTYEEHGIDGRKISINPYGVDAGLFKPVNRIRVANSPVNFVFVGLVDARKGVPFLLKAWEKSNTKNSTLTLVGPVSAATERLIRKNYPGVIIRGRISHKEIIASLPGFDVMVFPSFFEGFGLVIPEAMACGLPVITTNATCGPDIIENGKEGFIITPGNEQELVKAIETFIDQKDKAKQMGVFARQKAVQVNWDAYGDNWEKIIKKNTKENSRI